MPRVLKVFRTAIGFHDAYVAAPSQKAALEAWGAGANLFAQGMAEVVTDPQLTKGPLAHPGQVLKLARGTAAQHLAALPQNEKSPLGQTGLATKSEALVTKAGPRPSRRKLDAAEKALERVDDKYRKATEAVREREDALRRERHDLDAKHEVTTAKLSGALDTVRADYEQAMSEWRR